VYERDEIAVFQYSPADTFRGLTLSKRVFPRGDSGVDIAIIINIFIIIIIIIITTIKTDVPWIFHVTRCVPAFRRVASPFAR